VTGSRGILSVKYTPATTGGIGVALRFARYVQYRDGGRERDQVHDADSFTRYAADRDSARPEGRLFNAERTIGDEERRALVGYIRETTREDRAMGAERPGRAFYRMVISPEDSRGVDLRQLTRETMRQLERDAGRLPPWIAAEHRNTEHPHVHVIMAARVKTNDRTRTVMITKPRLERMKDTMSMELKPQNGLRLANTMSRGPDLRIAARSQALRPDPLQRIVSGEQRLSRALSPPSLAKGLSSFFGAMAKEFGRQAQLQAAEQRRLDHEREQELRRSRGRGE
jgi:hypothetical protein